VGMGREGGECFIGLWETGKDYCGVLIRNCCCDQLCSVSAPREKCVLCN